MKRGTFKKKPTKPMKRTALKARTPLRSSKLPKVKSKPKKTIKVDMSNNDTSSIRTNKTELVTDSIG